MKYRNLWDDGDLRKYLQPKSASTLDHDLSFRIYSSRLIGAVPDLVMHGGGNTSCKSLTEDLFGDELKVICVKGSGWDLGDIEKKGLPAMKLDPLLSLKSLKFLSDEEMVNIQRSNLLDYQSPNPSVETLLHAFLPYKFIDHTHSTPFLTLANLPNAKDIVKEIFGPKIAVVPYVMPGFELAKVAIEIHDESPDVEGLLLLQHGHFTWGDDAKQSYDRVIHQTNLVENWISTRRKPKDRNYLGKPNHIKQKFLQTLRGAIGSLNEIRGEGPIFHLVDDQTTLQFLQRKDLEKLSNLGVATPDHVIRLKPKPLLIGAKAPLTDPKFIKKLVCDFAENYKTYFNENKTNSSSEKYMLSPLPKLVWATGIGLIGIGESKKEAKIITDLASQNIKVMADGVDAGGFSPVKTPDLFDLEYWSLEQAKLGRGSPLKLKSKVAVVTGGAGAIGEEIAKIFLANGAEILLVDNNLESLSRVANELGNRVVPFCIDLTKPEAPEKIIEGVTSNFGGVDILISNAGYAPQGAIVDIEEKIIRDSFELNFFSHLMLARAFYDVFKTQNLGGQILFNISKQSVNPGKNFGAYGLPKATLLFLMRQLAVEFSDKNIRINGVNADRIRSGILTDEMIMERAKSRSIKKDDYLTSNLLNSEVKSSHVAEAFLALALSERTTGHVMTVDGGNVAAFLR